MGEDRRWQHPVVRAIGQLLRLWPAWIVSIMLVYLIYKFAPQQLTVTVYKALVLTLGTTIGFWAHVWVEGHLDDMDLDMQTEALMRRCIYCCSGMIAFALAA